MVGKKLFIFCVLAFAGFAAGVVASAPRLRIWQQERNVAAVQVERMHQAEKQREELIRSEAQAATPLGKEALARGHGYLKPGESPG
jgi:hypothetical protein